MTLPRPIPMLLAALGVVVLASTGVGLWLALTQKPPAWFFLGFELVIVMGAVFLIMLGMGKFKDGPAITLLCAAGAIGVCALLGWQATGRQINGHSVTWLLLLRAGIAGLLVLAAATEVALRDPQKTLPRIGWGLLAGIPVVALLALLQMGTLGRAIDKLTGGSQATAFGVWMVVGLIGCALVSASGHMLITGFQIGVQAWDRKVEGTGSVGGTAISSNGSAVPQATTQAPSSTVGGTKG